MHPRFIVSSRRVVHLGCHVPELAIGDGPEPYGNMYQQCLPYKQSAAAVSLVQDLADRYGLEFRTLNYSPASRDIGSTFDRLKVTLDGHCVCVINYKRFRQFRILVFHPHIFGHENEFVELMCFVELKAGVQFSRDGVIWYYSDQAEPSCSDVEALRACMFAFTLPSVLVKKCDFDALLESTDNSHNPNAKGLLLSGSN